MEAKIDANKTNYDESYLQEVNNLEELTRRILIIYPWFMVILFIIIYLLSF